MAELDSNEYLSTPRNNLLFKEYIKAKFNGGFGRLVYEKAIASKRTAIKKSLCIRKVDHYFRKNFDEITEDEMVIYRDLLNDDKICAQKTKCRSSKNFIVEDTGIPLKYRYKCDIKNTLEEFYRFIQEFIYQESGKEFPDIMKYFVLRKPDDYKNIIVDFIPEEDLDKLFGIIPTKNFEAFIKLGIMSAGRPCELISIRFGRSHNLYKNREGKWVIHLPNIKRVSYKKFPFVIDLYQDFLCPYFDSLDLKEGDLVFTYTENSFFRLMREYTKRALGRPYPPKILRKTARMIRVNAGYSTDFINKLMGHAPGSSVISHYLNYEGVKNDNPLAEQKLNEMQYPSLKKDYDKLKLELQAQKEQMKEMMDLILKKGVKSLKDQGIV
jgi:integrase